MMISQDTETKAPSAQVLRQIKLGALVCPRTKKLLTIGDKHLTTADGAQRYEFLGNVPILLADREKAEQYVNASQEMVTAYQETATPKGFIGRLRHGLDQLLRRDFRTRASVDACRNLFDGQAPNAVCISIGGGPGRGHPRLINLNIGPFPNVDVVADAHELPYADNSVDAIHCEAVLEHLKSPHDAVKEMYRVLKPNGKVFAVSPFLVAYHGYPHHYQNFTLSGHKDIFESNRFKVIEDGVCVGPVVAMVDLTGQFVRYFSPFGLGRIAHFCWRLFCLPFKPLDILLNKRKEAHRLAFTNYLVGLKEP
jgi:SAM-dependent methyltransferase